MFSPVCAAVIVPIAPGQSYVSGWDQTDDNGQQVPDGAYSLQVTYQDSSFANVFTCCPTLNICSSTASATVRNGSGTNPLTLSSVALPVLGGTWRVDLDCAGHAPGIAGLFVLDMPSTGPVIPFGELLVTGTRLLRIIQPHSGALTSFSAVVPNDIALCGLQGYAQGVCLGAPGGQVSNALDLTLGL